VEIGRDQFDAAKARHLWCERERVRVARVLADGGRTSVSRLARRLNIGPCKAARRGR